MPAYHAKALADLPKRQVTLYQWTPPEVREVPCLPVTLTLGPTATL